MQDSDDDEDSEFDLLVTSEAETQQIVLNPCRQTEEEEITLDPPPEPEPPDLDACQELNLEQVLSPAPTHLTTRTTSNATTA